MTASFIAPVKARQCGLLALFVAGAAWLGTHAGSAFPLHRLALMDDLSVAGLITGTVFQDYNANGRRDTAATITNADGSQLAVAFDRGVAGVTVTAYNADGSSAGSATTGADGSYSLNATGGGPYRVEFTNLPAGYFPSQVGDDSRSNVRFVAGASASELNYGINLPMAYCQDNPTLITSCFGFGDQSFSNPVIVSFPNSAGSTRTMGGAPFNDFDAPPHGNVANSDQVGTVWGIAYARGSRTLYASSFMKKHSGFGPNGPGAIYRVNPATGASALFFDAGAAAGTNPHDLADYDRDNGNATWNAVGKLSFGGIALNGAETRLFAMNLFDRKLYEIATDGSGSTRSSAAITSAPGCANGDVRPFAVHWNAGQLYVGVTCTAESTQRAAGLQGYIYRVDPASLALDATPLFQFPLNYPRRCVDGSQNGPGNCIPAAWRPWTTGFANIGTDGRAIYPQPWLTDIAFDRGDLIIGLRDRAGDQFGVETLENPNDGNRTYGISAGDTLRAANNGAGGFVLESNGRAGGNGTAPQGTGEGPGGGEFYFGDASIPFLDENGMGALLQIPGHANVIVNSTDPVPFDDLDTLFDGGPLWHNDNTGARTKSYRIYNGTRFIDSGATFGKANGLGDLVALCDPAPLELGNRVWNDLDCDGIQDANEPGLGGLGVQLIKNGVVVATTTTMPTGGYYFDRNNVPGGVLPNMDYVICLTSLPAGFELAPKDADSSANGDIRDSDAMLIDGKACIPVTTGGPGQNNPNLDFGLKSTPPTITCPAPVSVCATAGATSATVTYAAPVTTGPNVTVVCNPASGASFALGTTTVTCKASNTSGEATCSFTVTVTAAPTITCPTNITVAATSASGAVVTYPAPTTTGAGTTVSCDRASGSTFPLGTTTVICTATNACGTATCSFTVTVNTPPPTITCPAPISICLPPNASPNANVSYVVTGTGIGTTVACVPPSGSLFNLGTTTVNCKATNAGGEATCSFTVTVTDAPRITCPTDIKVTATSASGAAVTFATPVGGGLGTTVACDRASGSTFPIGTTKVTCTATNTCGTVSCSFNVVVEQPGKCDTLCYHSPQWWLLNLDRLPGGTVFIYGQNGGASVSTNNWRAIQQALQGNPFGFGLTPMQRFNQEYVAAQLNILSYGGPGAPTVANTMWANLSCYQIRFAPITLSNGAVLTPDSMVKELYMHITQAIQARRETDLAKLTVVLDLLNGNDLLNCN